MGPSPTARAARLENVQARDAAAFAALLEAMPVVPPYDIALPPGDPLGPLVREAGFEQYATTVQVSRAIERFPEGEPAEGVRLLTYDNAMADRYALWGWKGGVEANADRAVSRIGFDDSGRGSGKVPQMPAPVSDEAP